MRRRRRRPYDPLAPLSAKQLRKQANLLLENQLGGPRRSIAKAQAEARRQAQEDALTIQGFSTALAQLLGGAGAAVDKTYADAADRQQRIAQGYAMGQRTAQQSSADQANQLLKGSGQHVDVGSGSQVTYALGGAGPANYFNEAGAAFSAAAHNLPGMVAGRAQQEVAQRLSSGEKEQQRFRDQLEDLMARSPGLRADIMDRLYQRELSKSAQRTQQDYLGVSQGRLNLDTRTGLADVLGYDPVTGEPTAKTRENQGKQGNDARKARSSAFATNKDKAYALADSLYEGEEIANPDPNKRLEEPTVRRRITPGQAYRKLYARYGQPLRRYAPAKDRAWWDRQIEAMIWGALAYAGFNRPKTPRRNRKITRPGPS